MELELVWRHKLILKDLEERRFSHQSHIQLLGYKGKSVSFKHHNKLTLDGHEEVCSWYEAAERSPDEVQEGINCCDVGRGSSSVNVISCLRDSRLDGHHQDNAYIGWDCLEGCDDKITSTVFFFFFFSQNHNHHFKRMPWECFNWRPTEPNVNEHNLNTVLLWPTWLKRGLCEGKYHSPRITAMMVVEK